MAKSLLFRHLRDQIRRKYHRESLGNNKSVNEDIFLGRRAFLQNLAVASLSASSLLQMQSCAHDKSRSDEIKKHPNDSEKSVAPVIILGGGLAGITAAHDLALGGYPCQVFEATERLGGRMLTLEKFNEEGMYCELGGEFVDSNHADLIGLCREFDISLISFGEVDRGLEQSIYYFGGQYYKDSDALKCIEKMAPRFKRDFELLSSPAGLKRFDSLSIANYIKTYRGEVDSWFLRMIEVAFIGEFGLDSEELNSVLMLQSIAMDTSSFKLYGESDQAYCIEGGSQKLINSLEKFLNAKQVPIFYGHRLVKISNKGSNIHLTFENDRKIKEVIARKVICTIPYTVLREVEGIFELDLRVQKKAAIREAAYGLSGKLLLGYKSRSWRAGVFVSKNCAPIFKSNGMIYTDLENQNIWESSRGQVGQSGILTNFVGGLAGRDLGFQVQDIYAKNTDKIFPGTQSNRDHHVFLWNWAKYSMTKGSYQALRPGDLEKFGDASPLSELGDSIHFAGEHASEKFQGFMNGACFSGRRAAKAIMKLG